MHKAYNQPTGMLPHHGKKLGYLTLSFKQLYLLFLSMLSSKLHYNFGESWSLLNGSVTPQFFLSLLFFKVSLHKTKRSELTKHKLYLPLIFTYETNTSDKVLHLWFQSLRSLAQNRAFASLSSFRLCRWNFLINIYSEIKRKEKQIAKHIGYWCDTLKSHKN